MYKLSFQFLIISGSGFIFVHDIVKNPHIHGAVLKIHNLII